MISVVAGLAASIGVAMIITAMVLPNRKSAEVVNSMANGLANIIEAALGTR
jgi:hypothetical protein